MRKRFKPNGSYKKPKNHAKYSTYLKDLKSRSMEKKNSRIEGEGLPKFMIAKTKESQVDYKFWDDPNELVNRLRLLVAERSAGNNNHENEILSIIEELREAQFVY